MKTYQGYYNKKDFIHKFVLCDRILRINHRAKINKECFQYQNQCK